MIDVYDNVLENHEAQFVHHLLTDQEFMWQYQHRSDNTKPIYHWHRHAGKNDSDLQNNNFEPSALFDLIFLVPPLESPPIE